MTRAGAVTLAEFLMSRIEVDLELAKIHAAFAEANPLSVGASVALLPDCLKPERVVAECEAKRRVVEQTRAWGGVGSRQGAQALGNVLRILASVHSDHPDYREEWKP